MKREDIIHSLLDQARDKDLLADGDETSIFIEDAKALREAVALLKAQEPQATTHEAEWHIFKGRRGATCSYCKHTFDDVYDPENYDYYCRHCGARMVRIRTVKWE